MKKMTDYFEVIKDLIAEKEGVDAEDISEDSFFEGDLNIGEMQLVQILTELEEQFHVELIEDKENFDTVQDLLDALTEQVE